MERELFLAEKKAMNWLRYTASKFNSRGFSHSRRNWLPEFCAWRNPYPETSGYLIENFLYKNNNGEEDITIALKTAEWLTNIQDPSGCYHSGTKQKRSSSFNTAQILFGLAEAHLHSPDPKYQKSIGKAKSWLLQQIDEKGLWTEGLYVNGYFPSYYARAIWPMLMLAQSDEEKQLLQKSFERLWKNRDQKCLFRNAGFYPLQAALSHTVLYAMEGFFEIASLLNLKEVLNEIFEILENESIEILKTKTLWAMIDQEGRRNYRFRCLTGEAQMASLLLKMYLSRKENLLLRSSQLILQGLIRAQKHSSKRFLDGSFPASVPWYSDYFPLQSVNWTNKFFLDACYQYKLAIS
ncbi:MAG: hypothetical protein IPM48_04155 [Saprospiraceae bacterium]|nr:hypothetical protein [Saprospiraceae bacterium]